MTKRELVVRIANETGMIQQEVYTVVQKTLDYIVESLAQGNNVEFRNFGVFEVKTRKSRIGRNPNQPSHVVTIPTRRVVKFKMGKVMKRRVMKNVDESAPDASPQPSPAQQPPQPQQPQQSEGGSSLPPTFGQNPGSQNQ